MALGEDGLGLAWPRIYWQSFGERHLPAKRGSRPPAEIFLTDYTLPANRPVQYS